MLVYRICHKKWSGSLQASGNAARWNSDGIKVIYTASSRSLACLENIVHRSGEGLNSMFVVMVIEIPDNLLFHSVDSQILPNDWTLQSSYNITRKYGDEWIAESAHCVMKVPSAIIPEENNFLINLLHKDFTEIKLLRVEPFMFDERLKNK